MAMLNRLSPWVSLAAFLLPGMAAAAPVLGPEFQVNVSTLDAQLTPQVAVFPDGGFIVGWAAQPKANPGTAHTTSVHARLFAADGAPASGEFLLVPPGNVIALDGLVATADDSFAAVWDSYAKPTGGVPGDIQQVEVQMFRRGGSPLTHAKPAHLPMKPDGSFAVVWDEQNPAFPWLLPLGPEPPGPVHGHLFDADGTSQGPGEFQVNRRAPGQRTLPKIVWQPAGGYITIWEDESGQDGDGTGIFGRLLSADGTPTGGDFRVNVTTAGNQTSPALAAGPHATAVAVWLSGTATTVFARLIALP